MRRQDGAHRETAAERFGAGQDIRCHAVVHIGKQIAGTPHPALHFIKHQQRLMFVAQFTQAFQELWRRGHYTAFTLNRLNHNRAGVIVHHRFYGMEIVKRHMNDIGRFWAKTIGILRLSAHGNRKQRPPVEGVMEGNNFGFVRAVTR
ncbi:hypothetical protein D3C85_1381930 [compost metagenome]